MKKVIYNTCVADPWLKVAIKLNEDYDWNPVYWIGSFWDNSENTVPKSFPNVVYHSYFDAWRGNFPKEISKKYSDSYINIDFLKSISHNELQSIKMMDRLDYDRYSFNYMERERHFLNLIKHWTACIEIYKPDIVISAVNPHRIYDYTLYLLCKYYNIKYISFQYSLCEGRIYAVSDIFSIGNIFDEDYKFYLEEGNICKDDLPLDMQDRYNSVKYNYLENPLFYMKSYPILHKKRSNCFFLAKSFFSQNKFSDSIKKGVTQTIYKNKKYNIENTHFSLWDFVWLRGKTFAYNNFLQKYYISKTSKPNFDVPYIAFFLHYQPEETTSPSGDIFVNQRLCIEILLKHTPSHYLIYVKEHPHQFMSHMQGHTSRIKEFYDDLSAYSRVKLMSFEIDSHNLILNSIAVSTVTGTVGWEAMVHQKPVIIFGIVWYEKYSGVLRITNESSASRIVHFIKKYKFNEANLFAYLLAFSKNSINAYHYHDVKKRINLSEEECVHNLVEEILKVEKR
jgi:hypothetical protein